MRRSWLCAAAVTLAVMVVFAPRPWGGSGPRDSTYGSVMVGRVLAASFDAADLRAKDLRKPLRDLVPLSWVGGVIALLLAAMGSRIHTLIDPVGRYRLSVAVAAHGCRAPPPA